MKQFDTPHQGTVHAPAICQKISSHENLGYYQRFKKLIKVCWRQRRGLVYACIGLNIIRLALWLFPFNMVRQRLTKLAARWQQQDIAHPISVPAIVWCVTIASYYTPGKAKCLVKALTTQLLLNRYGYPHQLHIGVALNQTQALEAHAWIEYENHVIMGDLPDLSRFKPLSKTGVMI